MTRHADRKGTLGLVALARGALVAASACSSVGLSSPDAGGPGGTLDAATCADPGMPTPGPADTHCMEPDGGTRVTVVVPAVCTLVPDGGDDQGCPYGDTIYGTEGDDDDCKYHVSWSSTPLCEGAAPVLFTVTATLLATGAPLTGAATAAEVFTTTPLDAATDAGYCDDQSPHEDLKNRFGPMTEGPPGTYSGPVYFDQSGEWTVRFHFFENCFDVSGSAHGHAAFHVTVP